MRYLITGGCGFIGSNFGDMVLSSNPDNTLINVDVGTKISNNYLNDKYLGTTRYGFWKEDIVSDFWKYDIQNCDIVIHFAAESHVDKSLVDVENFIHSNILGTAKVIQGCIKYQKPIIYVSTDEVYGELRNNADFFTEDSPINPRNPYATTKSAGEFLVKSMANANPDLKYIITRCSNNFGPLQDSTKLIPVCINAILNNRKIPIYGNGSQIRDWIHVKDHCLAIEELATRLLSDDKFNQQVFNVGADNELTNLQLVTTICELMNVSPETTIKFIEDPRKNAHDFRYAIDSFKLNSYAGWSAKHTHPFIESLKETIESYKN